MSAASKADLDAIEWLNAVQCDLGSALDDAPAGKADDPRVRARVAAVKADLTRAHARAQQWYRLSRRDSVPR